MNDLIIVENKIYEIRGQKVMLDFDLAEMYEIETKYLKQMVRRNIERFPADFMFQLSNEEVNYLEISLRLQIATSNKGGNRYAPFAFTEQGVATLRTIAANIQINKRKQHATNGPQTGRGSIPGTKPDKNHGIMPVGGFQSGLPKRPGSEHINRCL